jgi:organic radical activating enzyme
MEIPKHYSIHSIFRTLQGEGYYAGTPSVFVRFSGCNIWSGKEETREADAKRHAPCARFCDTVFLGTDESKGGGRFTAKELSERVAAAWADASEPYIVMTGGEPGMQVDYELVETLHQELGAHVAIETNGTRLLPTNIDWVTLSPKPPMDPRTANSYDEVKVLSCFDPLPYAHFVFAGKRFIQPLDHGYKGETSEELQRDEVEKCLAFLREHPSWRLSVQLHKVLGIE